MTRLVAAPTCRNKDELEFDPVSISVNYVKNDGAQCMERAGYAAVAATGHGSIMRRRCPRLTG